MATLPAVAPVASAVAAITPSIKDAVLAQFKDAAVDITALAEKYRAVAFNVSTTKGMSEAKAARLELREKGRFAVQRAEKSVKADVNDLKRVMADEVARLVAIIQPVEDAIDAQIKAEEERKAAEKAERDRIEAERVAQHTARLAKIGAYLTHCKQPGMTAARIAAGIEMLAKTTFGADWQEFEGRALAAQVETLQAMRILHAQVAEREAEVIRLEAQRQEQARIAEQQAEAARVLAQQQAELAAQQQAAAANVARIDAIQARIAEIHAAAGGHERSSADDLNAAIGILQGLDMSERVYQEFTAQAMAALDTTLAKLQAMHTSAVEREAAAAVIIVPPDSSTLLAAMKGDGQAAPADVPLIQGEVGSINAGIKFVTPAESETIGNPPFAPLYQECAAFAKVSGAAAEPPADVEAAEPVGDVGEDAGPVDPTTQAGKVGSELERCRAALADACGLLENWIVTKCSKKYVDDQLAYVAKLRDMGGLPRKAPPTN